MREGIEHIDAFFEATFKPTRKLIEANAAFFRGLSDVEEIRVLGHGLTEVDQPYLEAVMDAVDLSRARWVISTYGDLEDRQRCFGAYGIAADLVTYKPLSDF